MRLPLERYLETIRADAAGIRFAYDRDPDARIPWSERWTVRSVARHVGGACHVVAGIIDQRPTADFGLFDGLQQPEKGDPAFGTWVEAGSEALCAGLRSTGLSEPCWTSIPDGTVGFWVRRMTAELIVHRWDAEVGAGIEPAHFDPEVSADCVDEFFVLALPVLRRERRAPAGRAAHLVATDAGVEWYVELHGDGGCAVSSTPVPVAATLRGPAAALLLAMYGRRTLYDAGVRLEGDRTVVDRADDVLPWG